MLIVAKIAQKSDFCENIFLPFYEANRSILGDQKVDLFHVFVRIHISKEETIQHLLSTITLFQTHEKNIRNIAKNCPVV